MIFKRPLLVTLFLLLLASSSWFISQRLDDGSGNAVVGDTSETDYYLRDTTLTVLNQDGKPSYRMFTERADHRPKQEESMLTSIRIEYYPKVDSIWHVTANSGIVADNLSKVYLTKGVSIKRQDQAFPGVIETDSMTLYPPEKTAESHSDILMTQDNNRIQARRMQLDFASEQLELQGKIRAHYEP